MCFPDRRKEQEIQIPGGGRGFGLPVGLTGRDVEREEVQGIAIREQGLFDKLVWMSTASCMCDHTDSSAPNTRPGQSLTHASEKNKGINKVEHPQPGLWVRSVQQSPAASLPTEGGWPSLLEMTEGRAQNLVFHLLSHS